ncbi:hypothetical protein K440DRAFT_641859 [Wilcoxina mikolae CBS 423.85]|nr:hypothetical protein K440DRAFT_641859 [Wilcoxina mikolae CBS 423.85]
MADYNRRTTGARLAPPVGVQAPVAENATTMAALEAPAPVPQYGYTQNVYSNPLYRIHLCTLTSAATSAATCAPVDYSSTNPSVAHGPQYQKQRWGPGKDLHQKPSAINSLHLQKSRSRLYGCSSQVSEQGSDAIAGTAVVGRGGWGVHSPGLGPGGARSMAEVKATTAQDKENLQIWTQSLESNAVTRSQSKGKQSLVGEGSGSSQDEGIQPLSAPMVTAENYTKQGGGATDSASAEKQRSSRCRLVHKIGKLQMCSY